MGGEPTGGGPVRRRTTDEPVFQHDFFETTSVVDFMLKDMGNPPEGYPVEPVPDTYSPRPFESDYERRRQAFVEHCLRNPASRTIKGYYYELVRMHAGRGPVHEGAVRAALNYIDERYDCSDFVMLGIIRLLYQLRDKEHASPGLVAAAERTVLGFKYWPDEPGIDSMCYWTENHQIMFSVNDYLAGQLFPEKTFTNSRMTGREKTARARKRILRWLDLRFKTGFNEWLSNVYFDEDLTALINLIDFCEDEELVRKAQIVTDLLLFDMAVNSYYGQFVSTHGRCYTKEKKSALVESTIDAAKLLFGMGVFASADNMSAVTLALSERYRMPRVIYNVATDTDREVMVNRQRVGINIAEAERWGLSFRDMDSGMVLLSFEAYAHPKTIGQVIRLFDAYRWWDNQFFGDFKRKRALLKWGRYVGLVALLTRLFERDLTRNTREECNIYTYRTPDYMLSSAQDYRKGYGGDQQHIWQATVGAGETGAVCFTTHPGRFEDASHGYWVGSGYLPRAAQVENVAVVIYNTPRMPGLLLKRPLPFTHAWFPRDRFDEMAEKDGWIFGRNGDGYVALRSRNPYRWQDEGEDAGREVIADGTANVWLCELGRRATDGSFDDFIERIARAALRFAGREKPGPGRPGSRHSRLGRIKTGAPAVSYHSPSQGLIEFGWHGPLTRNGEVVDLHDYPRYDNPYCTAPFPPRTIEIRADGSFLRLDFEKGLREADGFV